MHRRCGLHRPGIAITLYSYWHSIRITRLCSTLFHLVPQQKQARADIFSLLLHLFADPSNDIVNMHFTIFSIISLATLFNLSHGATSISLWYADNYKNQRYCVRNALDKVASAVGCDYNECLCRPDVTPGAESYLSSKISSGCSNDVDVTSGVQVYTSYCDKAVGKAAVTTTSQNASKTLARPRRKFSNTHCQQIPLTIPHQ